MRDPQRWLSDPEAPAEMGKMLEAAQSVAPTAAQKAALAARLGVAASASSTIPALIKALFAVGGAAAVTGAVVWGVSTSDTPAPRPAPQASHHRAAESELEPIQQLEEELAIASEREVEPETPLEQRVAVEATEEPKVAPPPSSPPKKQPKATATQPSTKIDAGFARPSPGVASTQPSEARLLAAARGVLKNDPERALQLLRQHAELYPSGVLAQEREVLRVSALKKAGRTSAAKKAAEDFREQHPDSVHHVTD